METKGRAAVKAITHPLRMIELNTNSKPASPSTIPTVRIFGSPLEKRKPPTLVSLCLGVVGKHFEDIIADLDEIAVNFPADIKMAMVAIAKRKKLLNDDVLISLADDSWEIIDISGSDVSDIGLAKVSETCKSVHAVDVSSCCKITEAGVSELLQNCCALVTLRWGGCPRSDYTARKCLDVLKPKLNNAEEDSWEELDTEEITNGARSLRWLVWPTVDTDSMETLLVECPRIVVNPKLSPFGAEWSEVPMEAFLDIALDEHVVKDIDPKTWSASKPTPSSGSNPCGLSMAEKFRLAFVERDMRLAPKRAKNARQRQRRAKREQMMTSTEAKALALASQVGTSLHW